MSCEITGSGLTPTPRYRNVVKAAASIAQRMGHSHVGVEHLFLAIIRDPDAIPTGELAAVADIGVIERKVLAVMNSALYRTSSLPPADD